VFAAERASSIRYPARDRRWSTNSRHDASRLATRGGWFTRAAHGRDGRLLVLANARSELNSECVGRRRRDYFHGSSRETAQRFIPRSTRPSTTHLRISSQDKGYGLDICRNVNCSRELRRKRQELPRRVRQLNARIERRDSSCIPEM